MDRIWKGLTRMDARGIFGLTLLLFLLVSGWWAWREFHPPRVAPPVAAPDDAHALPPPGALGALALVSNQFAPEALVVPVNPFRPTFEALVRNQAEAALQRGRREGDPRRRRPDRPPNGEPAPQPPPAAPPPPPPPTLTYRGLLQRPDGQVAAYVYDSGANSARFLVPGERLHNIELLSIDKACIGLRLPDGSEQTLPLNTPLTLPGESP